MRVSPCWRILPPESPAPDSGVAIRLSPGEGWGTGAHETTQLCLQAIGFLHPKSPIHALDFGSGSGILSIALARLGATVDAVEIDEAAIENGRFNARLNGMDSRLRFSRELTGGPYDWIVANILRSVLLEFAAELTRNLKPDGTLVLSGIVATDLPPLMVRYSSLLGGRTAEVFRRGDWCCLVWRRGSPPAREIVQ